MVSVLDCIVLIDAALHAKDCTREELEALCRTKRPGVSVLRAALTLADGRSESAWETLLRVLHVVCEVPVEPQFVLQDEDGNFLARADLWIIGTDGLQEYDGEDHLGRRGQRKDLRRARGLGNQRWVRLGYTSQDVLHQAVGILRDADLSLGREHRPERIRAWHALLADSLFTPRGRAMFLRRVRPSGRARDRPA